MKRRAWIAGIGLVAWACLPAGSGMAAEPEQKDAAANSNQGTELQFKQAATKFLQSAQAYLGITTLQWQNFMMSPQTKSVSEISKSNSEYKEKIGQEFAGLMTISSSEALSSKLKDYYAAWGLAFDSMRPTSADSARSFPARTNAELQRMDAMAARIKMDL